MGRFKIANRPALPAIALTADSAFLTAWSNDIGYDDAFARQVEALGRPGDVLMVSNTKALHYRGACSVLFTRFPTEFESRSLLILHRQGAEC